MGCAGQGGVDVLPASGQHGMTALFTKRISFSSVLPVRFAVSNAAILLSVCLAFAGSGHLPQWLAWENGLFESAQNFVLLTGCWLAVYAALQLQRPSSKALCAVAAMCWLVFFGREAAWGAVFMPPSGDSPWGACVEFEAVGVQAAGSVCRGATGCVGHVLDDPLQSLE